MSGGYENTTGIVMSVVPDRGGVRGGAAPVRPVATTVTTSLLKKEDIKREGRNGGYTWEIGTIRKNHLLWLRGYAWINGSSPVILDESSGRLTLTATQNAGPIPRQDGVFMEVDAEGMEEGVSDPKVVA